MMDASIVIATYNRSTLLARTLDSLALAETAALMPVAGEPPRPLAWEVVVVDNNSSDDTADVVRARAAGFPCPLRLISELEQGKSPALNTGLLASTGRIIVFTDDDVWIPPEWLVNGIGPLLVRSDIDYTGGPVRPMWEVEAPSWIAGDPGLLNAPIALVDYGTEPFIFEDRQRIPMGVNMAVRRSLIDRVGGFHLGLERRGNSLMGQGQAEFFCRTRDAGARGLYVPEMWLKHHVPASRLTREYYRRWWYWKGVARAQMQDLHPVTELGLDLRTVPRFVGTPRFMWGSTLRDAAAWFQAVMDGEEVRRAEAEMSMAYFTGYVRTRWGLIRDRRRGLESQAAPCPRGSSAAVGPG
jgi:glucosyl-dolichyl phosphate glucuronosyltransferase